MSRLFYLKLALNNLKKNGQSYWPYLFTCIGTISMYSIMHAMSANRALSKIAVGDHLRVLLVLGIIVVAIFSAIFLLYTNSFLIKRRKKEFGLFIILAAIMFWETVCTALISLTVGIVSGMILSKLMFLVLLKLVGLAVPIAVEIPLKTITTTSALFGTIFALSFLYNLGHVQLTKPIELLKGEQMGEREPKTKWLLILLGTVSLGAGYYIALTIESPVQALSLFFWAVLLVMMGTYNLFTAGSVGVLKLLRRNKDYYYQPRHFTTVSGLLFRMKQNAVGLANICILSSAVLVTLSTTLSLYVGVEDQLRTRFPREIEVTINRLQDQEIAGVRQQISSILGRHQVKASNTIDYRDLTVTIFQEENCFLTDPAYLKNFSPKFGFLIFLPLEDYAKMAQENLSLEENQAFVLSKNDYPYDTLWVLGHTFVVKNHEGQPLVGQKYLFLDSYVSRYYFVIVKDMTVMEELRQAQERVYGDSASDFAQYLGFDLESADENEIEIYKEIRASLANIPVIISSRAAEREGFYVLYGGLFFVGIFLGALFLMGTVLIIYYKQITEGYDDQRRFAIMQQVGMGESEVKKTIRSQILMVFFLPLITAGIHILVAFKMISKMLGIFDLTNIALFAWCSLGVFLIFGLCYGLVYAFTARTYYKIVRA